MDIALYLDLKSFLCTNIIEIIHLNRHTPLLDCTKEPFLLKHKTTHITHRTGKKYISLQSIYIYGETKKKRNVRHEWCQLTVQGLYVNMYLYK